MGSGKQKVSGVTGAKSPKVWVLVLALVVVVCGSVLFVGAVAGWFSGEGGAVRLSEEYYCGEDCSNEFVSLMAGEYEELVAAKKSFVMFVDHGGCTTAETMKGYLRAYMAERGIAIYRMSFSELKETGLYPEVVKYYPSVVIVGEGEPVVALRADKDEDAEVYNSRAALFEWLDRYIII